ncbi:hypothetical protein DFJ43DRAFT_1104939 [Lentinula guzmanii]|uniref:Uncharacterized protein n=1 Tax=Lentinula guzmanii TaxID=2804957 RepID=A0AA38JDJ5_9AGAR|nr:hypothetical protein DFJ43DRAFT_1104939 [Lentinula guzmanii]
MYFQSASNGKFMNTKHYGLLLSMDSSLSISSGLLLLSPLPGLMTLKGFEDSHVFPTLISSSPPSPLLGLNLRNLDEDRLASSSLNSSGRLSPLYELTSLSNFGPALTSSDIISSSSEVGALGDGHDRSGIHKAGPATSNMANQYTVTSGAQFTSHNDRNAYLGHFIHRNAMDKKKHNRDHAEDQARAPPAHLHSPEPDVLSCWETGPFSFIACGLPSDVDRDQELSRSRIGSCRIPDRKDDPIISNSHRYRWHGQRSICAPMPLCPLQQVLREMEELEKMVEDLLVCEVCVLSIEVFVYLEN